MIVAGALVGGSISTAIYLGDAWVTGQTPTLQGAAGAAMAGAVAGGVGVVAAPIAGALGLGTGILGVGAVNSAAGVIGYSAQTLIDPCTPFSAEGAALSGAFGGVGGFIGGELAPTTGMSNFRQVGFPRTWRGVIPPFMGSNARNSIYVGGFVSLGVGAVGPALGDDVLGTGP